MNVIKDDGEVPIRVWATDADDKTMAQAHNLARLPFAARVIWMKRPGRTKTLTW
jgi:hypothetical protein